MISSESLRRLFAGRPQLSGGGLSRRMRLLWTVGNLLMLAGVIVLLYAGGRYSLEEYNRYAARGDSDIPASALVDTADREPVPFVAPLPNAAVNWAPMSQAVPRETERDLLLNERIRQVPAPTASGQIGSKVPVEPATLQLAKVTRLVIPSIKVDSKVIEVGWDTVEQDGQQVAVWQVAQYAVGQHRGSANPGEGDNIVMAGHVGGYGRVFRDLYYVRAGEQVIVYVGEQKFVYTITERLVVDEEGVPTEQRIQNARYIEPTGSEMVTLVTCWPASGPKKFTQRVIVRAMPAETTPAS